VSGIDTSTLLSEILCLLIFVALESRQEGNNLFWT